MRIVNLKTFEGTSANSENWIFCYGFSKDGKPIYRESNIKKADFKISGLFAGTVEMSPMLRKGKSLAELLGISDKEANELIKPYVNGDVKMLNFVRESNLCGMGNYGKWRVYASKIPTPDYDCFNDKVLKRIGSEWRIVTPKVNRLLKKLEFQQIMGIEG